MDEPPSPAIVVEIRGDAKGRPRLIRLSDGRELLVSDDACTRAGVAIGAVANETFLAELDGAEQRAKAHEAALRLLSHRARSAKEMRTRLRMRGIEATAIEDEVARLETSGLLNDEQFARSWVADRGRMAPRGRRMLRYELLGRGIDPEAVEEATSGVDDLETARALARTRARGSALESYELFMSRVGGFLRRRGFSYDVVATVIRETWAESSGAPPSPDGAETVLGDGEVDEEL